MLKVRRKGPRIGDFVSMCVEGRYSGAVKCFDATEMVTVFHQTNTVVLANIAGSPVERIQMWCRDILNVSRWCLAYVDGECVSNQYRLRPGDALEFIYPWGFKGGSDNPPVTVKEAASVLRCSISFVYKLMKQGELSYEKRGRRKLPLLRSVEEYRSRNVVHALLPAQVEHRPPQSKRYKHLFN